MAIAHKTYIPVDEREEVRKDPVMRGLRVLIAHSSPLFRRHLRNGLKSLGFEITEVGDGIALLHLLAAVMSSEENTRYPQLIITDVNLPGNPGIHILTDLRRASITIPFILLGSGPTRVSAKLVRLLHRAVFVTLPVRWGGFLRALYTLLYKAGDLSVRPPLYGRPSLYAPGPWMHDQLIGKRVSRDQELRARERISP
jgi:CheY-like chemotaxis protein